MNKNIILAPIPSIDQLFLKVSPRFPLTLLMGLWRQPTELSILFWFMVVAGEDVKPHMPGWIQGRHAVLGEDLKLTARNTRQGIRGLLDEGILEQIEARQTDYRLSPQLVTKGNVEQLTKVYASKNQSDYIVVPHIKTRARIRHMLSQCEQYRERRIARRDAEDAAEAAASAASAKRRVG